MSATAIYEELLENCYAKTYKNIFYLENFWKIIRHFALFSSVLLLCENLTSID